MGMETAVVMVMVMAVMMVMLMLMVMVMAVEMAVVMMVVVSMFVLKRRTCAGTFGCSSPSRCSASRYFARSFSPKSDMNKVM